MTLSCKKDERAMVVGKIKEASDLATTEFVIDKVVFGSKSKKIFFVDISQTQFMAYSKVYVKTGIDLSKIQPEDIEVEGEKIILVLPAIEVVNFSYPAPDFVVDSVITDTKAFLNKLSLRDQERFFQEAELDVRSNLQYMGLVKTSQQHTRQLFEVLLSALGYKEIYISYKSNELLLPQVNLLDAEDMRILE
ncbi:DUF4230 domain-containing protein [Echinicola pacifica]|nr:DUF4230 domain-containing protein [Echinicola pacifica]